jgi:hypothetical protein
MAVGVDFSPLLAAVDFDGEMLAVLAVAGAVAGLLVAKRGVYAVMRMIEPYDSENKYHNGARDDYRWG